MNIFRFLVLVLCLLFCNTFLFSQSSLISISSNVPNIGLTACGSSQQFSITINNPSPFNLSNVSMVISMPNGVVYQPASIVGANQLNIANLSAPVFSLANIPSQTNVQVSFLASANCDILNYLSTGNPLENNITVQYTGNTNNFTTNHTTLNYIVYQPNLSVTGFANQSYSGDVGDNYNRCITITNGGLGAISQFTVTDVHTASVQINSVSAGSLFTLGNTETIVLSGADFTAVGNGNNQLDNGESIVVCEDVTVVNCQSVLSNYTIAWGCNGQNCQSINTTANVVFPDLTPNLVFTPIETQEACIGVGTSSTQKIKIKNTGQGDAVNVFLNVYQSTGSGFNTLFKSAIVLGSVVIKINNGAFNPVIVDSTHANQNYLCLAGATIGEFFLTIPIIAGGDSVELNWEVQGCCEKSHLNGWSFKGNYKDVCANAFLVPPTVGRYYSYLQSDLANNLSPANMVSNSTSSFNFLCSDFYNSYPVSAGGHYKVEYTIPPCLSFVNNPGELIIKNAIGSSTWNPNSVTVAGNVVTATFNCPIPAGFVGTLEKAQMIINLSLDCNNCNATNVNVKAALYYIPTTTGCNCEIFIDSASANTNIVCPVTCEGLNFKNFTINRTSYGLPDNNDDGIADVGALNYSLIRRDRAMYGDTVESVFTGLIKTSIANPNWQYCYAKSSITNGNLFTQFADTLSVFRNGVLAFQCVNMPLSGASNATNFIFDLSAPVLIANGCAPVGFLYQDNDSLVFEVEYKVTTNIGGNAINVGNVSNEFFVSNISNPLNAPDKFSCNNFKGYISVLGYYFTSWRDDSYVVQGCNQIAVSHNYYMSIGPCCNNYYGGNLFPYEYRNWALIDTATITVPPGYQFVAANLVEKRTAGTLNWVNSATIPITPVSTTNGTFVFDLEPLFQGGIPQLIKSDDGYLGTITVTITPSCQVQSNTTLPICHRWKFIGSNYLDNSLNALVAQECNQDYITYKGPDLFLQSSLPTISATTNIASWDITLSNIENTNANNTWLYPQTISGVTINQVIDVATNTVLVPVGGFYQLGVLSAASSKQYKVLATYTSCSIDSVMLYAGWDCSGYPAAFAAYPCPTKSIKLKVVPQSPLLLTNVTSPAGTISLCSVSTFTVEGVNVQLGSAYNLILTATLPLGVSVLNGTSSISYPVTNPYVVISDPVNIGGNNWQWNVSALNASIGTDGLQGILSTTLNTVRIKFDITTDCSYVSGSSMAFDFQGQSACGAATGQLVSLSSQLGITGANQNYNADVVLKTNYLSPCNSFNTLKVRVNNIGPGATSVTDSLTVTLPANVTFVNGSVISIHNGPTNTIPIITTINGKQQLSWELPPGVNMADSVVFTIEYAGIADSLACEIYKFYALTTNVSSVNCVSSGTNCNIGVVTGADTLDVFTYKAYLTLSNASGYTIPDGSNGEIAIVDFSINNYGEQITSNNNTVVSYYFDSNNNGIIDPTDLLVTKDTINVLIPSNGSYAYHDSVSIPPGYACRLIAVIDTAYNPCSCSPFELPLVLPLKKTALDTIICSGSNLSIGYPGANLYNYSWSPAVDLNDATISNPTYIGMNNINGPITNTYVLTVDRIHCTSKDTSIITVYNIPISNAGIDSNICGLTPFTLYANQPDLYSVGTWSVIAGASNSTFSSAANFNSSFTNMIEGTYTLEWIVTNTVCPIQKDTVIVTFFDPPLAIVGNDTTLCGVYNATLQANNIAGMSSGLWTQTDGPSLATIITNSLSVTAINNLQEGSYEFTWTVSNGNCPDAKDSIVIHVYNPPNASYIINDDSICEGSCVLFTDQSIESVLDTIVSWQWMGSDGSVYGGASNNFCFDSAGTYGFNLIVTSDHGCKDTAFAVDSVVVIDTPIANYMVSPNPTTITSPEVQFVNNSSAYTNWLWSFGDASPDDNIQQSPNHIYTSEAPGTYTTSLIVKNDFGCADTAEQVVTIGPDFVLYAPNTFIPDDDGLNDLFELKGIGIELFNVYIYDRWGELLFSSNNINTSWNGKKENTGTLCKQDVYVWKVQLKTILGQSISYIGHVTLLR